MTAMTATDAPEADASIEVHHGAAFAVTRIEAGLLPAAARVMVRTEHGWWSAYAFGPDPAVPGYEHPTVEDDPRGPLNGRALWAADLATDYAHTIASTLEGPRR